MLHRDRDENKDRVIEENHNKYNDDYNEEDAMSALDDKGQGAVRSSGGRPSKVDTETQIEYFDRDESDISIGPSKESTAESASVSASHPLPVSPVPIVDGRDGDTVLTEWLTALRSIILDEGTEDCRGGSGAWKTASRSGSVGGEGVLGDINIGDGFAYAASSSFATKVLLCFVCKSQEYRNIKIA